MPIYHQQPENDSEETVRRRAYQSYGCSLLHFGPVALYCNPRFLEEDMQRLTEEAFEIRTVNASKWDTAQSLHTDLQKCLEFPDWYGKNFNALADCLRDVAISDTGGLVVVIWNFDDFANRDASMANGVLDVFARASRLLQVFGKSFLVLVHSKNPDIRIDRLGAVEAWWNSKEFARKNRGCDQTS
jgi:RNAse (barnase) inhibitor barstar